MMLRYFLFISILLIIKPLYAHTFTGMNGFYDGLSHPVLGLDSSVIRNAIETLLLGSSAALISYYVGYYLKDKLNL